MPTQVENMSLNLYQEAIIEAKQLRQVAEQNAKNKIIEALTPQIQVMIEQQLSDDLDDLESEPALENEIEVDQDLEDSPLPQSEELPPLTLDLGSALDLDSSELEDFNDEEDDDDDDSDITLDVDGELKLDFESDDDDDDDDDEDELLLSKSGVEMLESYIHKSRNKKIVNKVNVLESKVKNLNKAIGAVDFRKLTLSEKKIALTYYGRLLNELFSLSQSVIIMSESVDERLEYRILGMLKEIKDMSRRKDRSAFRRLFEELTQDEGLREQEDDTAEAEDNEEATEAADVDVDAAQGALEDLGAALGLDVNVEDEGGDDEDEDDEEVELELEEGDHADEGEDEMDETEDEMDEVYEISEAAIARELRRMRKIREQSEAAVEADPALQHGGEEVGDVILDVDEEDLINALADEIGDTDVPATPPMVAAESRRRRRRNSRRNLGESRVSRENNRLKKQLQEMNLFNAKLLFANKLMQNRGLSTKQQRTIVEALDKASTIKEAKVLYQALSNSLQHRSGKSLNEGSSRLLSSASRSTRSAAPAKSGVEVDRWAVLAGLHNK